jgi:hypothetical protein
VDTVVDRVDRVDTLAHTVDKVDTADILVDNSVDILDTVGNRHMYNWMFLVEHDYSHT